MTLLLVFYSYTSYTYASLNQAQFDSILEEVQNEFQTDMQALDLQFTLNKQWKSEERLASIKIPQGKAILSISGFMARQELMSEDSFRLLLCHEVGHVLGGAPKQSPGHWSSTEGQADYYSTAKCIKRLIPENDEQYSRVKAASLALAQMDAIGNGNHPESVSLDKRDSSQVMASITTHPNSQCRLDTMIAGLNCSVDPHIDFDTTNSDIGACVRRSSDEEMRNAARPRCWFRPPTKRLYCTSEEKFSDFGGTIPQLTVIQDDQRDDGTIGIQLAPSLNNPLKIPVTRALIQGNAMVHSNYTLTKVSDKRYEISVQRDYVDSLRSLSLVPIQWENVVWNESGDQYHFQLNCNEQ